MLGTKRLKIALLHGIVRYQYAMGDDEMNRRYGIGKEKYYGPYECDVEDFKKFFNEVTKLSPTGSGEVKTILLTTAKGLWRWYKGSKKWIYLGR